MLHPAIEVSVRPLRLALVAAVRLACGLVPRREGVWPHGGADLCHPRSAKCVADGSAGLMRGRCAASHPLGTRPADSRPVSISTCRSARWPLTLGIHQRPPIRSPRFLSYSLTGSWLAVMPCPHAGIASAACSLCRE